MQQHAGQVVHGSRDGKLKAAHVEAGKQIANMARGNPGSRSFTIDTFRGFTFDDGGVKTPLSMFHLTEFGRHLQDTKSARSYEISGSKVTFHLTEAGFQGLQKYVAAKPPEVPRKPSEVTMRERVLAGARAERAKAAGQLSAGHQSEPLTGTALGLVEPILQTLLTGTASPEDIAKAVAIRKRVPSILRSQAYLPNGTTFDAAVAHSLDYLISRRLVANPARRLGLTPAGRECALSREKLVAEGFVEPSAPLQATVAQKKPLLAIKVMNDADILSFMESLPAKPVRDLLAIWRNAVRIVADDTKEQYHRQSRVMLRAIEAEWNDRSAKADLAESFRWPDAGIRGAVKEDDRKSDCFADLVEHGMLKEMGYTVGRNGLSSPVRQKMLTEIFRRSLPPIFPKPYMDQWGANGSARRLHKIADSLAAFARNAGRMSGNYDEAISDWKADLEYLYERHYAGQFGFSWPKRVDEVGPGMRR